ncbi:MAG: symmetrical bis(5'-nucleosyl)-tetraphosphatase [Xanthomonadaceae bacterium]|nr:symmetrical bis(5'-nucleosyl)-tetraphosphatase [Xanthomonadaceae bacterium]
MSTRRHIFIGDLQGCWEAFGRLLDKLRFDPASDRLCLAGDLVNRGGQSLKVLREVVGLGEPHFSVLGNHDLHLLAYAHRHPKVRKKNPEFERILDHAQGHEMLDWLRRQPLVWMNDDLQIALVHAGIDPRWDPDQARRAASEVTAALRGPRFSKFIDHMYGNQPARWMPEQKRYVRLRTTTNVLTRMRFVQADGHLELESSGDLQNPPAGYRPWFELLNPSWRHWSIVFGHWSMLGYHNHADGRAICLDSGCVWGGALTALVVEDGQRSMVQIGCK